MLSEERINQIAEDTAATAMRLNSVLRDGLNAMKRCYLCDEPAHVHSPSLNLDFCLDSMCTTELNRLLREKGLPFQKMVGDDDLETLLASVKLTNPKRKTMFESPGIEPYEFCPKCGCQETTTDGNKATR